MIFPGASEPEGDSTPIRLPDVYGAGVAYRSTDGALALAVEWDRVEYSTIIDSLTIEANVMLEDGDELHVGGEYVLVRTSPVVALRAGAWLDPDPRSAATSEGRVFTVFLLGIAILVAVFEESTFFAEQVRPQLADPETPTPAPAG